MMQLIIKDINRSARVVYRSYFTFNTIQLRKFGTGKIYLSTNCNAVGSINISAGNFRRCHFIMNYLDGPRVMPTISLRL